MTTLAPRRAAASSFSYTGNRYLTSTGAAGSYADAATSAAARVVFPGATLGTYTVAFWAKWSLTSPTSPVRVFEVSDDAQPRVGLYAFDDGAPGFGADAYDAGGSLFGGGTDIYESTTPWHHYAITCNGSNAFVLYSNGAAVDTFDPSAGAYTYAAVDALTLFGRYDHSLPLTGSMRQPAIWSSALSGANVSALYALGTTGDPRTIGAGPVHWWPADGDTSPTITDRGSVGTCNLTLHGGVSIGTDP